MCPCACTWPVCLPVYMLACFLSACQWMYIGLQVLCWVCVCACGWHLMILKGCHGVDVSWQLPSGFHRGTVWEEDARKADVNRGQHLSAPAWDCEALSSSFSNSLWQTQCKFTDVPVPNTHHQLSVCKHVLVYILYIYVYCAIAIYFLVGSILLILFYLIWSH